MKKNLRDLLDEREVSVTDIAKGTGLSRRTIYNVINGSHNAYRVTICKICIFFGVDWRDYV